MFTPFLKQCFVTIGAALNMVSCGFTVAFAPSLLLQLRETNYINITEDQSSWLASITGISEIVGIIMAPLLMDYLGRRKAILFGTVNMFVGWILIIISTKYSIFMFARFLQGLSMGVTSILTPVLIGEYTSPKSRGSFLSTIPFSIFGGCLAAHSLGFILNWKTTAAIYAFVAIINLVIILLSPESPSFLAANGKFEESRKVFHWLRGLDEEEELEKLTKYSMAIIEANNQQRRNNTVSIKIKENIDYIKNVFKRKTFYMPLFLMFHLQMINAWNGCALFHAYAIKVVQNIVGNDVNLPVIILSVDVFVLLLSFVSMFITEKFKRRTILFMTVPFNILTYLLIAAYTYCKSRQILPWDHSYIGMLLIYLHMFSVAVGCVPLPNIIAGEIFGLQFKGVSSLLSSTFFALNMFVSLKTGPQLFSSLSFSGTFCMYACFVTYAFFVLAFYLPETKDKILQDIEDGFKINRSLREIDISYNKIETLLHLQETT